MLFITRNCAFVNFTNISNAIKAIDAIKNKPEYANLRIAHGKDRCANPPRSGPQGGNAKRMASGNGVNGGEQMSATGEGAEDADAAFLNGDDELAEMHMDGIDAPLQANGVSAA